MPAPSAGVGHVGEDATLATVPAVVWEADPVSFATTYVSPRSADILGHAPATWLAEPGFWLDHVHPDDRATVLASTEDAARSTVARQVEYRFRTADGSYRWFQDTVQVVEDGHGRRLVGVMVDVTDARVRADTAAAEAVAAVATVQAAAAGQQHLNEVLDNLADGVYYVDRGRRISYWNRGAEQLTGYRAPEVIGRHCYDNLLGHVDAVGTQLCHAGCPLSASIADGKPRQAQVWLRHADGSRRAVQVRTAPVRGEDGAIVGAVEVFSDATGLVEARDAADAARKEAFTDPLTGLPNRRLLDAVLTARQDDLDRHRLPFGLLVIDVDFFKRFNDNFGHDIGDQALLVLASTLRAAVRGGDSVTRWGGEEFAIVAAQVDADGLARLGERVLALVRAAQVPSPRGPLPIRVSIGAALALPEQPLPELFVRADQALLAAKRGGRDRIVLSAPSPIHAAARVLGRRGQ